MSTTDSRINFGKWASIGFLAQQSTSIKSSLPDRPVTTMLAHPRRGSSSTVMEAIIRSVMYNAGKEERPLVTEYAFINNITGITSQVQKLLTERDSRHHLLPELFRFLNMGNLLDFVQI